jgi:hypothetical protein
MPAAAPAPAAGVSLPGGLPSPGGEPGGMLVGPVLAIVLVIFCYGRS